MFKKPNTDDKVNNIAGPAVQCGDDGRENTGGGRGFKFLRDGRPHTCCNDNIMKNRFIYRGLMRC